MRFITTSNPRLDHAVEHQKRGNRDPGDADRDEDLPAQSHDLVVAVAWERGAEPDEAAHEEGDLDEQPPPAIRQQSREHGDITYPRLRERRQPATHEEDHGEELLS